MWETLLENLLQFGIGGAVAGIVLWILWKILQKERENYMKIISQQRTTEDNHIAHLDESVKEQATEIRMQGERFNSGIDKLCGAIKSQTEILKAHIKKGE